MKRSFLWFLLLAACGGSSPDATSDNATDGGTRACAHASIGRCNGFMAAVDVIRDEADIPRRDACRFKIAYRLRSIVISVE